MTSNEPKGGPKGGQRPSDDYKRRQQRKNWAVLIVLAGLAVLFYLITIVRMGNHG